MESREPYPVPEELVADAAMTGLTLLYSAPTPGAGSRYVDGPVVAHETRVLAASAVRGALVGAGKRGVGETVLETALASRRLAGFADVRAAAYLAPLARAALLGQTSSRVVSRLGHEEIAPFVRALDLSGEDGALGGALRLALGGGRDTTLRDAMRFAAARDPLAREYARNYEVTNQLARPAILDALSRSESARAALVHSYLEVLAEVPDLDIVARAGQREADEVSRMARGVLKAGGVYSRRGLQSISNLDGLLRADTRLSPTATEPPVAAAAFLVALEEGPGFLGYRVRPATGR